MILSRGVLTGKAATLALLLAFGLVRASHTFAGGANSSAQVNPMVHAEGTRLVDGAGKPLVLRGANVEGWLQCPGVPWGCGFVSESTVAERLTKLAGAEEVAKFREAIAERYIQERDIARMSELGFNCVRLAFNHRILDDDARPKEYKDSGWKLIDRALDWCEKYSIYVVLDLHAAPGGQSGVFVADPDEKGRRLWDIESNRIRTVALWKAIAARYADRRIIAGYDLLNEPEPPNGKALVELYKEIIAAIRSADSYHMVILEGSDFARDLSMFSGRLDANQTYSFHLYTWFGDNREKWLKRFQMISRDQNIPMWCGEWGENTYDMVGSTLAMFEKPENLVGAGHCYWTWKRAPTRYPPLLCINESGKWKKLASWIEHPFFHKKPSKEDALAAMQEFLSAVEIDKTDENQVMVKILTNRQTNAQFKGDNRRSP